MSSIIETSSIYDLPANDSTGLEIVDIEAKLDETKIDPNDFWVGSSENESLGRGKVFDFIMGGGDELVDGGSDSESIVDESGDNHLAATESSESVVLEFFRNGEVCNNWADFNPEEDLYVSGINTNEVEYDSVTGKLFVGDREIAQLQPNLNLEINDDKNDFEIF